MGLDNNDYEKEALKVELEYIRLLGTLLLGVFSATGLLVVKGKYEDLEIFLLTAFGITICLFSGFIILKTEKIASILKRLKKQIR